MHCLYGSGMETAERLIFSKGTPDGKATLIMGDGDGTVNERSLAACQIWQTTQKQPIYSRAFPKRDHMAVLKVQFIFLNFNRRAYYIYFKFCRIRTLWRT